LKVALGVILGVFGLYLSVTAVFEITKQWSLVFPGFIGDPKIGIHFGRARGPMLQCRSTRYVYQQLALLRYGRFLFGFTRRRYSVLAPHPFLTPN
jgi:hypothetical protein